MELQNQLRESESHVRRVTASSRIGIFCAEMATLRALVRGRRPG
jgi:hypothetical protein